ncbi:MAG: hypothetical protein HY655_11310, partial [Acidobacteria bacterium]|nr:hypothetical protein [Acidobacteriota bacterium]
MLGLSTLGRWRPTCSADCTLFWGDTRMGRPASLLIDQAAELLGVSRRTVYYR